TVTMAKSKRSELVEAAEALDDELHRFETAAEAAAKAPMNSQKHLERAAKQLSAIAESDEQLQTCVKQLVDAVSASRDRQVKHAAALGAAAARLQQRTEVLQGLMTEFGALGTSAGALNGSV